MKVLLMNILSATTLAFTVVVTLSATGLAQPQQGREDQALGEYTKAMFLLESNQPRQAISHLLAAYTLSDRDEQIGVKLAETLLAVGEVDQCEEVADDILRQTKNNPDALLLKAKVLYSRGDKIDAVQYLRASIASGENNFEAQRILGRVLFELGRDEEALDAFEEALALERGHPFLLYTYGLLLNEVGQGEESEAALREALALEPRFTDAALELSRVLVDGGRLDEAEVVLGDYLAYDPEHYEALLILSNIYIERGKYDDAIRLLESRAQTAALPYELNIALGRAYYEANQYDDALRVFGALYEEGARSADMARILGEISLKADDTQASERYYREAIALEPADYRNYMALFLAASSEFAGPDAPRIDLNDEEMAGLLELAAGNAAAEDFDAYYLVGIAYQSMDGLIEAEKYLALALTIRPEDDRALLNLASVLEKQERYDEARARIKVLHELKPDDPAVCNFYGYLLALMGSDLDRAEELVRTALKQDPENGYYTDSLGWVYYMRGEYKLAVIELEKASRLAANDPVILEHLGDAYQASKRYADALTAYERSLDLQGQNAEVSDKIDATRQQLDAN